ncbi:AraC family transcriptional regulator [Pelagicoccus mobilis]|uniref:Helix-turn-helix domain-containing protein n=1 Tax=Pelagicoccus mobilis TaxID=415221 RepID=A0A934RWG8_9BACT|nr:AraC family transcriptional regulator [Pelagicoccus mobilis]MBK1877766.1 helix-turn-helix domain-containing protein [Pelagicoccus mobilis]
MSVDLRNASQRLKGLGMTTPDDYFHGLKARNLCVADNLVIFLRTEKRILQTKSFDSRPHHRFVLILCFETEGSISVDGRIFHLTPGDAFLVKPYQFHFYLEMQSQKLNWLFITFETRNAKPFDSFANTSIPLSEELCEQALQIASHYAERERLDEVTLDMLTFSVSSLLNKLRAYSLNRSRKLIESPAYPTFGYDLVDKINTQLEQSLEDNISILQISERLAISESHLRKRFKQLTGLSLGSYLVHYKLNRAVKLLVHSDDSLTQIAFDCGYDSLAAFSRSFKKQLGSTPSQYRKTEKFERLKQ